MRPRIALILIIMLLWASAAVRFHDLAKLPTGFNGEELDNLRVSETIRAGRLGVFYDVQQSAYSGREGLFPGLESIATDLLGDGFFCFRVLPALAGLLAVALVYSAGRRLIGTIGGLVAALVMAFGVLPVLLSRLVIAQTLIVPLVALLLWLIPYAVHIDRQGIGAGRLRTIPFTVIGLCLAIAAYSHWIGLLLWPLYLVGIIYLWRTRQPVNRHLLSYGGYSLLVGLIIAIPYVTTTLRVPDLSGMAAIWLQRPASVGTLLINSRNLLVSLLGGADISILLLLPIALLFVLGLIAAVRCWRQPGIALLLVSVGFGLLPAIWAGRGDYNLALAVPGAALLIGFGGQSLWDRFTVPDSRGKSDHPRRVLLLTLLGALAMLLFVAGLNAIIFNDWAADPLTARQFHTDWGDLALYLNADTDPSPLLICTENLTGSADQPLSQPALLQLMLHRERDQLRFSDCRTALVLAAGGQPERVVFRTVRDKSGQLQIPAAIHSWLTSGQAVTPMAGNDRLTMMTLSVEQPLADAIGRAALNPASWSLDTANKRDPAPLPVRMGDYLTFEGYTLDPQRHYQAGDYIYLSTYWRIDGAQQPDVRVFAHIISNTDQPPVMQNDGFAVLPNWLHPRDIVVQDQTIQVPYPFPDGLYWVSVGAYHASTQARVPLFDQDGQVRSDRLFLGTIRIGG